ncbi:MAG: hypothetical protein JXA01_09480 [Dehalococcoidia bacterium]|nr:hypothetical protein [Dehalococcoidia bacterium]
MAKMIVQAEKERGAEQIDVNNFWAGKQPCWEKCHCPDMIKGECPAAKYQFLPCWEIEGTYCKLNDMGTTGRDTRVCEVCPVYKKYGNDEPIRLKLYGRGMDRAIKEPVNSVIYI